MKHSVRRQTLSVALFPFLAVLICTMGALIVLLVLFTHHARAGAKASLANVELTQASLKSDPEAQRKLREQIEDANWRRELLEHQRAEKAEELAGSRARLAHLEQHIQELQARAKELLDRASQIDQGRQLRDGELAAEQAELARLQDEIARRRQELDQARRKHQSQEQWYALIPYDGPNGTRRRPIYIECTVEGVVIQPEGIAFRVEDFNGPLGPGNPLDAALRTIREHLQRADSKTGEPYPLLVVRPSGVVAYSAARSALKAWDDEFGYELISDDKKLAYGEPDPALAASLARSVAQARQRQALLVAKMPRKFGDDEAITSFDPASVPGLASSSAGTIGRGVGSGTGGTAAGSGRTTGGGFGGFSQSAASELAAGGPSLGSPTGEASAQRGQSGAAYPSTGQPGPYGSNVGQPGIGQPGGGHQGTGQQGGPPAVAGQTSGPGAAIPAGAARVPGGQAVASMLGQPATGDAAASAGSGRRSGVRSGQSRGNNWGLPGAAGRTTGITRPIHVAVLADRFVLVPDAGDDHPPRHLRLRGELSQAELDAFVAAVQKEMNGWGLAVEGGYWKPVLNVEVAPDAERHFADLAKGLENSGFELQRKLR